MLNDHGYDNDSDTEISQASSLYSFVVSGGHKERNPTLNSELFAMCQS